jgi:hypothetical protein
VINGREGLVDDDGTRPKRWERSLAGERMPADPAERVAWMLEQPSQILDAATVALLQVVIHAGTALRCRRAVLAVLADRTAPDRTARALGEASMAAVALYLAAHAAERYCKEQDTPGPLGRHRLAELVSTAEHMRDCVMHWHDKAQAASPAFLSVTEHDVLVVGAARPGARGPSTIAGLSWRQLELHADRLRRWAEFALDERLAADTPA